MGLEKPLVQIREEGKSLICWIAINPLLLVPVKFLSAEKFLFDKSQITPQVVPCQLKEN